MLKYEDVLMLIDICAGELPFKFNIDDLFRVAVPRVKAVCDKQSLKAYEHFLLAWEIDLLKERDPLESLFKQCLRVLNQ